MRNLSPWPLLIPLMLLAPGCAKPPFTYDVDRAFPAALYRTMAPDPRTDRVLIREGFHPIDSGRQLKAVLNELEARNYQLAPSAEADLWVTVQVLAEAPPGGRGGGSPKAAHKGGSGGGHRGGGPGGPGGGGSSKPGGGGGAPREGMGHRGGKLTVIVQFLDRASGLPVWQGEANLDPRNPPSDGRDPSPEATMHLLLKPLPMHP